MTLAQLDFAEFADAAFNASFRANYTQDMATAAQVRAAQSHLSDPPVSAALVFMFGIEIFNAR